MGWLDKIRNRRRKPDDLPDIPLGMGDDGEPEEGGPSPFRGELAQLRWIHQQESVNLARSNYEPTVWPGGRISFELEMALAHSHEGLRDRLQIWSQDKITSSAEDLYQLIEEVASARNDLDRADEEYTHTLKAWRIAHHELEDDPLEVSRYNKLKSPNTQALKRALMFIFVVSEFIITGFIFDKALPLDFPLLGYVLALGVMVMLTAIPHFVAQGIKEGITKHHKWEIDRCEKLKIEPTLEKQRQAHREQQDDRGFKIASAAVGGLLLALALPLAALRASETLKDSKVAWFFTFLIIQFGVSGYFFLREWLDHGAPSANLFKLDEQKDLAAATRADAYDDYAAALTAYFEDSGTLFKTILDAPRYDSYIVDCYRESLHFGRHLHTVEQPELAVFINGARQPYLGAASEITEARGLAMDSAYNEHRSLEADDPNGRQWWLESIKAAAQAAERSDRETRDDQELERAADGQHTEERHPTRSPVGTLIDSMARAWLYDNLREHFNLGPYNPPAFALDVIEDGALPNATTTVIEKPADSGSTSSQESVASIFDRKGRSTGTDDTLSSDATPSPGSDT